MLVILNLIVFAIYILLSITNGYLYRTLQYINREQNGSVRWVLPETIKVLKYHNIALIVVSTLQVSLLIGGYVYGLNPIMLVIAFILGSFSFKLGKYKARQHFTDCIK